MSGDDALEVMQLQCLLEAKERENSLLRQQLCNKVDQQGYVMQLEARLADLQQRHALMQANQAISDASFLNSSLPQFPLSMASYPSGNKQDASSPSTIISRLPHDVFSLAESALQAITHLHTMLKNSQTDPTASDSDTNATQSGNSIPRHDSGSDSGARCTSSGIANGVQSLASAQDHSVAAIAVGRNTENAKARNAEGGITEGRNTEGRNTEGRNTEGRNTEGRNTEGRNTEGRNTEGRNAEGGSAEGGNAEGRNSEARDAQERTGATSDSAQSSSAIADGYKEACRFAVSTREPRTDDADTANRQNNVSADTAHKQDTISAGTTQDAPNADRPTYVQSLSGFPGAEDADEGPDAEGVCNGPEAEDADEGPDAEAEDADEGPDAEGVCNGPGTKDGGGSPDIDNNAASAGANVVIEVAQGDGGLIGSPRGDGIVIDASGSADCIVETLQDVDQILDSSEGADCIVESLTVEVQMCGAASWDAVSSKEPVSKSDLLLNSSNSFAASPGLLQNLSNSPKTSLDGLQRLQGAAATCPQLLEELRNSSTTSTNAVQKVLDSSATCPDSSRTPAPLRVAGTLAGVVVGARAISQNAQVCGISLDQHSLTSPCDPTSSCSEALQSQQPHSHEQSNADCTGNGVASAGCIDSGEINADCAGDGKVNADCAGDGVVNADCTGAQDENADCTSTREENADCTGQGEAIAACTRSEELHADGTGSGQAVGKEQEGTACSDSPPGREAADPAGVIKSAGEQGDDRVVELNVGGRVFQAAASTLLLVPGCRFHQLLACSGHRGAQAVLRDSAGRLFLPYDANIFAVVLLMLQEMQLMGRCSASPLDSIAAHKHPYATKLIQVLGLQPLLQNIAAFPTPTTNYTDHLSRSTPASTIEAGTVPPLTARTTDGTQFVQSVVPSASGHWMPEHATSAEAFSGPSMSWQATSGPPGTPGQGAAAPSMPWHAASGVPAGAFGPLAMGRQGIRWHVTSGQPDVFGQGSPGAAAGMPWHATTVQPGTFQPAGQGGGSNHSKLGNHSGSGQYPNGAPVGQHQSWLYGYDAGLGPPPAPFPTYGGQVATAPRGNGAAHEVPAAGRGSIGNMYALMSRLQSTS